MYSEIWIHKGSGKQHLTSQRCGYSPDGATFFSCSAGEPSPLAGATFRFKASDRDPGTVNCGRIAVCADGCGMHTPRELLESGHECYDQAECPSLEMTKTGAVVLRTVNGVVKVSNVNLRENPHSQSRILRTVLYGSRVKVVDYTGHCTLVEGKAGVWIRVTVLDSKAPDEGWMFDANVSYQAQFPAPPSSAEQGVAADRRENAAPAER
jgi:hypothetical protein